MVITESELLLELGEALTDQLDSKDHSEFEVLYEAHPSEILPPRNSQKELTDLSFIADLMVVKNIDWVPQELDNIENIQRWFPTDSVKIPLLIMK